MRAVSQDAPILRPAARVLLIDDQNRLLLLCAKFSEGEVWIMPGGTLEPGETIEQAAARQLWEETGVQSAELGPCVWTRVHEFEWGGTRYEQHERFFVVRVTSPTITLDNSSVEELQLLSEWRWWTAEEIAQSDAMFAPRKLAKILPAILAGDFPGEPIAVDS